VPSVLAPDENNWLINPAHADYKTIVVLEVESLSCRRHRRHADRDRSRIWNRCRFVILVDSNVPMYLVGAPHRHKVDSQRLLEKLITDPQRLVNSLAHITRCGCHSPRSFGRTGPVRSPIPKTHCPRLLSTTQRAFSQSSPNCRCNASVPSSCDESAQLPSPLTSVCNPFRLFVGDTCHGVE
jgi:hypothetical protein